MPFTSFDELSDAVALWADNDQLTDSLADFIHLAEVRLQRDLKMRFTEATTTGVFVADQDYLTLPTGCIEPRALTITTAPASTVEIVGPTEFQRVKAIWADVGIPQVAMSRTLTLALAPTPSSALAYELIAWYGITPLTALNPTNWLLETAPDCLLYGALVEAGLYMGNDERLQSWQMKYEDSKNALRRQEFRARTGGGPLRIRSDGATP